MFNLTNQYLKLCCFSSPLCLKVVSIDHRPAQPTPAGPLAVTNCVLRTGDGHRVEASGWQAHACTLAALCVGSAYWFTNCVTRAKYQRLDCWFRIGVGGPNALVVPHVAPEVSFLFILILNGYFFYNLCLSFRQTFHQCWPFKLAQGVMRSGCRQT
jgi:hypothetical protein